MMLLTESPTSPSSLRDIFVEWVTLGLHLILLAASRGLGVCQNMITWLVQHATCLRSGYGMISNDDGPLAVVVNNSQVVRIESLRSFLKGSRIKMHNVFNMSEGKWNAADYYDITENDHEIITQQPMSEIKWIHCKSEIDDYQSRTGYRSIRSFSDSIRKNQMLPPGDACTLMSACEDDPSLPKRVMQWFLLNCIAMLAIYELQMKNLRNIQDPEIKTDAHGSSFTNMVNCETEFTLKEPCVSSSGAGFELKNQSNLKSRNQGETCLSDSSTNMINETDTSNVPRNSDTHRQEGENGYHSPTVIPRHGDRLRSLWDVTSEVISNVSETDSNVHTYGLREGSASRADSMDEVWGMTVRDKESEVRVDMKEGSTMHVGGKREASDTQIVGRRGASDSQAGLTQNDREVHVDGKPERSNMQADGKLKRSDLQVDSKPERSDMQVDGNSERPDMQADGKPKGSDVQVDGKPESSDMQAGTTPETDVNTLTEAGQIPNTKSCVKKPKRQRKRTYWYRDRRKHHFVNPRKSPQPQKFRGSKNIPGSASEETGTFQFHSKTELLHRSSRTSQNSETNRQTEEAFFKGQGHHPCEGDPKTCSDFVQGLLYKAGDNMKTIKLKEELKFLLRPEQQLPELQTAKGLAMHCLPKMELWEIERLMESERWGHRHETCVDHVLQELIAHGLKVGHVVQYFSQHHSRRQDIVRVIQKIHGNCKFCACLYDDDDYDRTSGSVGQTKRWCLETSSRF